MCSTSLSLLLGCKGSVSAICQARFPNGKWPPTDETLQLTRGFFIYALGGVITQAFASGNLFQCTL